VSQQLIHSLLSLVRLCAFSPTAVTLQSKVSSTVVADKYPISLLQHILQVAEIVETAVATHRSKGNDAMTDVEDKVTSSSSSSSSAAAAAAAACSSSPAAASASAEYVALLSPYRFGEVEEFTAHHYFKQYAASASAPNRVWVKRLATEYGQANATHSEHAETSLANCIASHRIALHPCSL
jgi:hypothetical protein